MPCGNKKGEVDDLAVKIMRAALVVGRFASAVRGDHVHTMAGFIEEDFAIDQRKQSPIASGADVVAGNEFSAALADQNASSGNKFTAETFYAQPFAYTITPVTDASLTFLVCHIL